MRKLIGLILLTLLSILAPAQTPKERIQNLCKEWSKAGTMHGYVLVSQNDTLIYSGPVAYANISEKSMADSSSVYAIGSLTKTYMACLVLMFVEEKKLDLDGDIYKYFPEMPYSKQISIRSLLNHHSGLTDSKYLQWRHNGKKLKLVKKPVYANANYGILGEIIEQLEGRDLASVFRDKLFDPYGLQNSYFGSAQIEHVNWSKPYVRKDQKWVEVPLGTLEDAGGAGAMLATAADVDRFLQLLFQDSIISENSRKEMQEFSDHFGMGLFQAVYPGMKGYTNSGSFGAYKSTFVVFPDQGISIVILCNGLDSSINPKLLQIMKAVKDED